MAQLLACLQRFAVLRHEARIQTLCVCNSNALSPDILLPLTDSGQKFLPLSLVSYSCFLSQCCPTFSSKQNTSFLTQSKSISCCIPKESTHTPGRIPGYLVFLQFDLTPQGLGAFPGRQWATSTSVILVASMLKPVPSEFRVPGWGLSPQTGHWQGFG